MIFGSVYLLLFDSLLYFVLVQRETWLATASTKSSNAAFIRKPNRTSSYGCTSVSLPIFSQYSFTNAWKYNVYTYHWRYRTFVCTRWTFFARIFFVPYSPLCNLTCALTFSNRTFFTPKSSYFRCWWLTFLFTFHFSSSVFAFCHFFLFFSWSSIICSSLFIPLLLHV